MQVAGFSDKVSEHISLANNHSDTAFLFINKLEAVNQSQWSSAQDNNSTWSMPLLQFYSHRILAAVLINASIPSQRLGHSSKQKNPAKIQLKPELVNTVYSSSGLHLHMWLYIFPGQEAFRRSGH